MSNRTWRRLADRLAGKPEAETLYEGLPDHLDIPVRQWLASVLRHYPLGDLIAVRLRLPREVLNSRDTVEALANYHDSRNPLILMEIVDAALAGLLECRDNYQAPRHIVTSNLDRMLREGGSAYEVASDSISLQRRVDGTVQAVFDKAKEAAASAGDGEAADHLRDAFAAAYGMKPDPGAAYSHAVKAVEAVANPLFLPNDTSPPWARSGPIWTRGGTSTSWSSPTRLAPPRAPTQSWN
jgi:hypothetical protein